MVKSKYKKMSPVRLAYYLGALVLLMSIAAADGDQKDPKTSPYDFGMPVNLLPVQAPKDNPTTNEGVALGRQLFYDPILSGNQKQACAGCHKQEFSFTDGEEKSIGSEGKKARRNSMSLANLGWQDRFFWDGRAESLEELVHFPVMDTLEMHADTAELARRLNRDPGYKSAFKKTFGKDTITMALASKAIAQFMRTIVSYNTPFDRIFRDYVANYKDGLVVNDHQLLLNGLDKGNEEKYGHDEALIRKIKEVSPNTRVLNVFSKCLICHYNSLQLFCLKCDGATLQPNARVQFKNNGLEVTGRDTGLYQRSRREEDKYLFKVPSFRNLVFTGPYMHDGRFKTLEEVVEHYNSGIVPNQNLDTLLMDSDKNPIRFHLDESEKKQLVGLLRLFTDSSIVTDPRFAAPVRQ